MMKNTCIVIVDRYRTCGYRLRNRLLACEAKICVFHTFPPALELLKHKTVDAVVLDFGLDEATTAFWRRPKHFEFPSFLHALERAKIRGRALRMSFRPARRSLRCHRK